MTSASERTAVRRRTPSPPRRRGRRPAAHRLALPAAGRTRRAHADAGAGGAADGAGLDRCRWRAHAATVGCRLRRGAACRQRMEPTRRSHPPPITAARAQRRVPRGGRARLLRGRSLNWRRRGYFGSSTFACRRLRFPAAQRSPLRRRARRDSDRSAPREAAAAASASAGLAAGGPRRPAASCARKARRRDAAAASSCCKRPRRRARRFEAAAVRRCLALFDVDQTAMTARCRQGLKTAIDLDRRNASARTWSSACAARRWRRVAGFPADLREARISA